MLVSNRNMATTIAAAVLSEMSEAVPMVAGEEALPEGTTEPNAVAENAEEVGEEDQTTSRWRMCKTSEAKARRMRRRRRPATSLDGYILARLAVLARSVARRAFRSSRQQMRRLPDAER